MPNLTGVVTETDGKKTFVVEGMLFTVGKNVPDIQAMLRAKHIDVGVTVEVDYDVNNFNNRTYNLVSSVNIIGSQNAPSTVPAPSSGPPLAQDLDPDKKLLREISLTLLKAYLQEPGQTAKNSNLQAFLSDTVEISQTLANAATDYFAKVKEAEEIIFEWKANEEGDVPY